MKQTNNAIKFLLAQYRAIFNHAYLKGIASSVALTACLATGSANAATNFDPASHTISGEVTISEKTFSFGDQEYNQAGGATILNDPEGWGEGNYGLQLSGSSSSTAFTLNNAVFSVKTDDHAGFGARVAFGNGTFNISGSNTISQMLTIDAGNASGSGDTNKTTLSGGGELIINGYLTISMAAGDNKADLTGANIFVKADTVGDKEETIDGGLIIDPSITVGNLTFTGNSDINLYYDQWNWEENESYQSAIADRVFTKDKVIYIAKDKAVTFGTGTHTITSSKDLKDTEQYTSETRFSLTFDQKSDGTGAAPIVKVNSDATLIVDRDLNIKGGVQFNNSGNLTINEGSVFSVIDSSSGSALTIASGSTFNNNGQFVVSGSKAKASFDVSSVKNMEDLGEFTNSGTITLTAEQSGTFTINGNDDLSKLLNEGDTNKFSGALVLNKVTLDSTGTLTLAQAEMSEFSGSTEGTIHADRINFEADASDGVDLNGVKVFGDQLVLSDSDGDTTLVSGSSSSATNTFIAYSVSSNNAITLGDNISLEMVNQGNTAQTGDINAALTLSGSSSKPKLTVSDLEVKAQNISLEKSGSLVVSGSKLTTGLNLGTNTLEVKDGDSSVEVNNAYLSAKEVSAGAGSISVDNSGSLTANTIDAGSGQGINLKNSTLIIKGDSSDSSHLAITNADKINVTNGFVDLTDASDTVGLSFDSSTSAWTVDKSYTNKIKIDGATVKVDLSNVVSSSLTFDQANKLLGNLASGTGLIDIGNTQITIASGDISVNESTQKTEISADKVKDANGNVSINVTNSQTQNLVLTNVEEGKTVTGGWEGVKTAGTSVNVAGKLALYGTADNNNNIVADADNNVVNLNLTDGSTAEFNTTGNVGAISGSGTVSLSANSDITVVNKQYPSDKKDDVTVSTITGAGSLTAKDIQSVNTTLSQGSKISAENYTVDQSGSFDITGTTLTVNKTLDLTKVDTNNSGTASITGSFITATTINATSANFDQSFVSGETINVKDAEFTSGSVVSGKTLSGTTVTVSDSQLKLDSVSVDKLTLTEGASANLDTVNLSGANSVFQVGSDADEASGVTGSTAQAQIQILDLNGGLLQVDPDWNQATALVTVNKLSNGTITGGDNNTDIGVAEGSILVGRNSAVGLGLQNISELQEVISKYQVGSSLDPAQYGAILYVDGALKIAKDEGITLTSQSMSGFETNLPTALGGNSVADNTIYFGANTALIVNGDNGAFITFAGDNTNASKLVADGGKVIINGDVKADEYTIFKTDDTTNGMKVVNGDDTTDNAQLEVTTENGLLTGVITNDTETGTKTSGNAQMSVNMDEAGSILNAASTPVFNTIIAYGRGYNGDDTNDKLFSKYNDKGEPDYTAKYNNYFLQQELIKGNGSSTEKVARLGVYGGATQAALVAGESTYDAVAGRMGVGAQTGNITFADNGQGAGLWVTPIYKNQDSDGFGAQGLSYGADLDLYGVALGGDFTLANGLRVGAAFNVGSGDADGQGAGAGVSNDFDYYGFAVYGGFTYDKLSIVGDVSYTVVDNDVEANTQFEKVSASMDTSDLSVGVTAQYGLNYNGLGITPHAGLRYSYIDMDDYTVKGSADIAKYNGDSLSVFSIPVGVTFAKDFTAGAWTIKPAFDLTLTANMGDDSIDGSVAWAEIENLNTKLESEVLDSFTYGATLGVAAKSGNLSFGLGVNYTGASNADSYGVTANARFVF